MEYGYEITDSAGNKRFFVEGCTCCHMSTGGVHELSCPCRNPPIETIQDKLAAIREKSHSGLGGAWRRLAQE